MVNKNKNQRVVVQGRLPSCYLLVVVLTHTPCTVHERDRRCCDGIVLKKVRNVSSVKSVIKSLLYTETTLVLRRFCRHSIYGITRWEIVLTCYIGLRHSAKHRKMTGFDSHIRTLEGVAQRGSSGQICDLSRLFF